MTNNYHYFGMTNDQLIEQVCDFLFNPKNGFNGVVRKACYGVSKHVFKESLLAYLDTGINLLDEFDQMMCGYENSDSQFGRYLFTNEQISFFEQALIGNSYWDIFSIYSDDAMLALKEKIEFSKAHWERINSREGKRRAACGFTCKATIRTQVFERDGKQCKFCKTDQNLTLDHIIPITKGGVNEIDNLQVLCRSCNSKKSNKI